MSLHQTILDKLLSQYPDAKLRLNDFTGSGDHWEMEICTEAFRGKSKVKQHQMVYGPLRELIDANTVHALKLTTLLPEQWD